MPNLDYVYQPVYGVEPYQDNGGLGGAKITQDNLVITAWQILAKAIPAPAYFTFGPLIKSAEVNTALDPAARVAGLQAFPSRHSTYFYFNGNTGAMQVPVQILGLVLNPPPEMKQLLQGAVEYNGGNPALLSSYTVKKSLQAAYAWRAMWYQANSHNLQLLSGSGGLFSSYLFFTDASPLEATSGRLPFLKTNGADGVAPTFFDASTPTGVNQMIEAVNDGEFFVMYATVVDVAEDEDPPVGNYVDIFYPHSAARA